MEAEIYHIINEVVNTSPVLGQALSPEWRAVLHSDVGLQQLQSNYEELYNRHMANPHEITLDLYTRMNERYNLLRNSYMNLAKDHAALKDGLECLTRQFAKSADVREVIIYRFSFS